MCTDDRNVVRWVERDRSHSPAPNRILKAANRPPLQREVVLFPVYVRSERNMFANGLTKWSKIELEGWLAQEGAAQVDASSRLWAEMSLSYNPDRNVDPPPPTLLR